MASSLNYTRVFSRGPCRAVANAIREPVTSVPSRTFRALPVQRTLPQRQHGSKPLQSLSRTFTTTTAYSAPKTMGQLRARNSTGPFSWKAALLFVVTGGGMIVYFQVEKERLARKRIAEMSKGVGRPKVGGPFVLRDLNGEVVTEEALRGKYSFVYFGFTHCPDICPDELDKMAAIIDNVNDATKDESLFLP
ncbi:Cu-binding protein, partial [Elasticomyces elasticus]